MENIIIKPGAEFYNYDQVFGLGVAKRIKFSEKSRANIHNKDIPFYKGVVQQPIESSVTPKAVSNVSEVSSPTQMKKVNPASSVLDNVILNNVYPFTVGNFTSLNYQLLRLTDNMYNKVSKHTKLADSLNVANVGELTDGSVDGGVGNVSSMDASVDSTNLQSTVNDAFTSIPNDAVFSSVDDEVNLSKDEHEETDVSDSNSVKKASYTKAKVEKYNDFVKDTLPRFVLSDNDIFSHLDISLEENNAIQEDSMEKRDIPLVVNERNETDLSVSNIVDNVSVGHHDESSEKAELHSVEDEDVADILAELQQLQKVDEETERDTKLAAEQFETSVKALNDSVQKMQEVQKEREEAITRARLIKDTLQAEVEEKRKKLLDFQEKTEQNMAEVRKNNDTIQKTEAGIQELRDSMPKQLTHAFRTRS